MRYVCTEGFAVDLYNDDGFSTGKYLIIEEGEVYSTDDSNFRVIGGDIRLESENGNWLELPKEYVEQFFKAFEEEE